MMRISVVGGGIAGLALAALLDPSRFTVSVHEHQPRREGLGTALGMWPSARRALRAIGAEHVLPEPLRASGAGLYTADGAPLLVSSSESELPVLVGRTTLLRALADAVPASVHRVEEQVTDPRELGADLVVGADGVHSVVRRASWGERTASRLTPYLVVRGLVGPDHTAYGEHWGAGRLFGITPVPGGATNWFCAYRSDMGPRRVDVREALADARSRFVDTAPVIREVLAEATPEATLAQRLWVAPPLPSYVRGRTVLIGDAAHAMTPNLGRGACEALVDAHVLARELNAGGPQEVSRALRRYQARRVLPSQAVRLGSGALARVALAERLAAPRDAALGAIGRAARGGRAARDRRAVGGA